MISGPLYSGKKRSCSVMNCSASLSMINLSGEAYCLNRKSCCQRYVVIELMEKYTATIMEIVERKGKTDVSCDDT